MDRLDDLLLQTHNWRAIAVAAQTKIDGTSSIVFVKVPTSWLMSVDFLDLIRESIIAMRQESLVIDSVCDDVSFPWMAVAGMSCWQFDMPCFSHLQQLDLLSSLTQLGQSDHGCSDSISLEAFTNTFIQIVAVSFFLNPVWIPSHDYVFKLFWCEYIQTQVLLRNSEKSSWLRQLSKEETK